MDLKNYILRFQEHTDGEDSLYRHVEWTSNYDCPVKDLKPGETVPFKPDKSMSEPSIHCVRITDTEIELSYAGYSGHLESGIHTYKVVLSEQNPYWYTSNYGGRYDTDNRLMLIKPEKA